MGTFSYYSERNEKREEVESVQRGLLNPKLGPVVES